MLKYMLDTNICIFTVKNRPQQVREAFNRHHGQLCISPRQFSLWSSYFRLYSRPLRSGRSGGAPVGHVPNFREIDDYAFICN